MPEKEFILTNQEKKWEKELTLISAMHGKNFS